VGHYTKLAIIALRASGMLIMLYALPMFLYAFVFFLVAGPARTSAPGARPAASTGSTPLAWLLYGLVGVALYALAVPFGRQVARDLD
jgi:hypothetical protein